MPAAAAAMYGRWVRATVKGPGVHTCTLPGLALAACRCTSPADTAPPRAHTCLACKTNPARKPAGRQWVPHPSALPCQPPGWGSASGTAQGRVMSQPAAPEAPHVAAVRATRACPGLSDLGPASCAGL